MGTTAPGPVGGAYVGHDSFVDCLSALKYPTVGQSRGTDKRGMPFSRSLLVLRINNSRAPVANKVLRLLGHDLRVDFQTETADGLILHLSDPNDSNFMIDDEVKLWAIDFGRTYFLPASFVSYSLTMSSDVSVQSVARRINYPSSANLPAMCAASGGLVVFNDNALGK